MEFRCCVGTTRYHTLFRRSRGERVTPENKDNGTIRYQRQERVMATTSMSKHRQKGGDETKVRERILEAAFRAFRKSGYATTSTLEIATRARFEARALRASWQQTGNADRLYQRAREATGRTR